MIKNNLNSSAQSLNEKYKLCPMCKKKTKLNIESKNIYVHCECGFLLIFDENEKLLRHIFNINGNTYCGRCGCKIEGGYCGCTYS